VCDTLITRKSLSANQQKKKVYNKKEDEENTEFWVKCRKSIKGNLLGGTKTTTKGRRRLLRLTSLPSLLSYICNPHEHCNKIKIREESFFL
jgi:hypothetical protein